MPPQPQPPDPNTVTFDAVLKLMRDDRMRSFRVDIETDSTIEADENEHKQRLIEFMGAVSTFMQHALPAGQQHPELIPFLGESMSTLVRGFRVGRQLEGTIEEAMQSLGDRAKKAMSGGPQIPPDMQIKIEGEKAKVEAAKITAQAEATRAQADMQIAQLKVQSAQAEHQQGMQRLAMEQRVAELEAQRAQQKHDREMQLAGLQHAQEVNRMQLEAQQNALQSVLEPPVGPPAAPPTGDAPMALPQQPDQNAFI